ncbi:hypothetical protein AB0H00_24560 [Nocardia sp. NPDC023852]|uniref:hypothetical protein n=1 Tax=Nocardia sp. NPDC023852 TaxID=3154697 RepID=UPI0033D9590A
MTDPTHAVDERLQIQQATLEAALTTGVLDLEAGLVAIVPESRPLARAQEWALLRTTSTTQSFKGRDGTPQFTSCQRADRPRSQL